MLGSLMMFASGNFAKCPSSARSSLTACFSERKSENCERTLADKEISRVSIFMLADEAKACTMGKNEYVARAGASSVFVYMIVDCCIQNIFPWNNQ